MEKDMFPILKTYLIKHGYDVKAEVMHADIVAKKEDTILIVEMKTSLTTTLMYQGLKRMHIANDVYLAIPKPTTKHMKSSTFHEKKTIVRRLQLGLILVDVDQKKVEVLCDPKPYHFKKQYKKKKKLLSEFNQRKTALNIGGVHQTKIITAYMELSLLGLDLLKDGPQKTSYVRAQLKQQKIVNIFQDNYRGWFERVSHGVYQLTEKGHRAWDIYQDVISEIKKKTV